MVSRTKDMKSAIRWLLMLSLTTCSGPALAQAAPTLSVSQDSGETRVDDVIVTGEQVQRTARAYVAAIGASPDEREPAAWRARICVGVGGMSPEPARILADRVSDWGHSLGLAIASPGCTPNIMIVAAEDGDATARKLVAARPRQFRTGAPGSDRGGAALQAFQDSDRPIRWWHVSLPVNENTGMLAGRMPGHWINLPPVISRPSDLGLAGMTVLPSRLSDDQIRDDLQQVVIVLEAAALEDASFDQIADYVSMVALAQVDPNASPDVPSILHLFSADRAGEPTLSRWDQAFLRALYDTRLDGRTQNAKLSLIARATARQLQAIPDTQIEDE